MPRTSLYVDIDGTLAEWKSCSSIEQLLEPGYFYHLAPQQSVVDAVRHIIHERPDIQVYSLSAISMESIYAFLDKLHWLDKYIPEIITAHRLFCPCGQDKALLVNAGAADFLLDDYTLNLQQWASHGANAIKLLNGINGTNGTWKGPKVSKDLDAKQLANEICRFIDLKSKFS